VTFTVPSISGKTLGTNNNDSLLVTAWTSAGSDYNSRFATTLGLQTIGVDLWGVHIKVGTHTTAATDLYKQPELGPELARCQRYHTRLACAIRGSQSFAGQEVIWDTALPVTMRGTPSTVISNASPSGAMNGGPAVANVYPDTVTVLSTSFSALNANGACSFTLALDAEL
jgi:hypothetical protein